MAYSGTTAVTSNANPPRGVINPLGSNTVTGSTVILGLNLWMYSSTDSSTRVMGSNYFTDGFYIGMKEGDFLMGIQKTSAGSSAVSYFGAISAVTTSGCNLSTGGTMTSTFS